MKFNLTLFLLLATSFAIAQNAIYPHKKSFEKKWLKADKYEMTWYALRDTQRIKIGTVSTRINLSKADVTIITEVNMLGRSTKWIDTTVAEIETLKPIYHSSYNMNRDMVLKFANVVTGFYDDKVKGTKTVVSDTTGTTRYFDSNIYPHLIRLLPLKDGYSVTIPIYDYNPNGKTGIVNAYIEKVDSDTIQHNQKHVSIWRITVSDELGTGEKSTSTYFIGKEDRKLLRQEIVAGKRKMSMELSE